MQPHDVMLTWKLAKVELDDGRSERAPDAQAEAEKSVEAVEMWLREIGALPPR